MRHAAPPFSARDFHEVPFAEVIDVCDDAAGLYHADGCVERVGVSARDDDLVHALPSRPLQNLRGKIAVFVAQKIRRAILRGHVHAVFPRPDAVYISCPAQDTRAHRHEPDGANADDADALAELNVGQLRRVKAGRHHIAEHAGRAGVQVIRQVRHICVRFVHMENLCKHAVFEV